MTERNCSKVDPWVKFRKPWPKGCIDEWMQENWNDFFIHPSEIISRSIPIAEYWHTHNIAEYWPIGGIYFLLIDGKVCYVGISRQLVIRVQTHANTKPFDAITVLPLTWDNTVLGHVETAYINWLHPWFNSQVSRYCGQFDPAISSLVKESGDPEPYMFRGTECDHVVQLSGSCKKNKDEPLHLAARTPSWNTEISRIDSEFKKVL